ncbi:MAG TPA: hypothetical protein VJ596_00130 [Gemmatimonadaceae bacterium]|nr:hypothetical protein [Gemmatimonadaceae bacterium]
MNHEYVGAFSASQGWTLPGAQVDAMLREFHRVHGGSNLAASRALASYLVGRRSADSCSAYSIMMR